LEAGAKNVHCRATKQGGRSAFVILIGRKRAGIEGGSFAYIKTQEERQVTKSNRGAGTRSGKQQKR